VEDKYDYLDMINKQLYFYCIDRYLIEHANHSLNTGNSDVT